MFTSPRARINTRTYGATRRRRGAQAIIAGGALTAVLAVGLLGAPASSARIAAADSSMQVHRSLQMQVSSVSGWSGAVTVGSRGRIDGQRRSWRGMPVTLWLTRQTCDISGCVTTEISTTEDQAVLGMAHVGAGLGKASLAPQVVPVKVTTSHRGRVLGESRALLTVSVTAQGQGRVQRETTVVDGQRHQDRQWLFGQGVVSIMGEDGESLTLESSQALIQVTRTVIPRER
jgi:hypothetical protein